MKNCMKQSLSPLILVILFVACSAGMQERTRTQTPAESKDSLKAEIPVNYDIPLADLLDSLGISGDQLSVLIDKSDYRLRLMQDTSLIKEYPVVFGGNPVDDKRMEGDQCTPEGEFRMISKYPHRSWSKFVWINYPTAGSREKHNEAKAKGEIPQDARIGGQIGIHGVPEGTDYMIDEGINWTLGCISLKNVDINEIYMLFTESTPIIIIP
jgi:murein L,D-transpeptidase YafK